MEFAMDNLIRLFKLASLGKMTGGLIHNINGPLQNIGLDLEMSQYILQKEAEKNEGGLESNILVRLKRIEDELERLNAMIKMTSNKVIQPDNELQNFNEYLEQELSFLNANLYFKHNVEKTLKLDDDPPVTGNFSSNAILAFGWLLQIAAEDMQETKTDAVTIKTKKENNTFKISIHTEKSSVAETVKEVSNNKKLDSKALKACNNEEAGLIIIMNIFRIEGIDINAEISDQAVLNISLPLN